MDVWNSHSKLILITFDVSNLHARFICIRNNCLYSSDKYCCFFTFITFDGCLILWL